LIPKTTAKFMVLNWIYRCSFTGSGCFSIKIQPNAKLKTKWRVRPVFSITLHKKDISLLEAIQNTVGVGKISRSGKKAVTSAVDSIRDIPIIIAHFDKYPLITYKLSDYLIFRQCFEIIKQREHLTVKGLLKLIALKSSLPEEFRFTPKSYKKKAFPNVEAKDRPQYFFKGIPDPFWVSGFTSGEGSFHIVVNQKSKSKPGVLFARMGLHLHVRDQDVFKGLASYFTLYNTEISNITTYKKIGIRKRSASLQYSQISDLVNIIIPFFNKYPILGKKGLDFSDFQKVCDMIKTKKHQTSPSVFQQILKIKSGINLNRK